MSKESYIRGFCKAAEAAGVDPKALVEYSQQQLPMSSYSQRRIAELRARAAKLKSATSPSVTTNANGSVVSRWKGSLRRGKLMPSASASQHQPVAPIQKAAPSATTAPTSANKPEVRINNTLF